MGRSRQGSLLAAIGACELGSGVALIAALETVEAPWIAGLGILVLCALLLGLLAFAPTRPMTIGFSASVGLLVSAGIGFLLVLAFALSGYGEPVDAEGTSGFAILLTEDSFYRSLGLLGLLQAGAVCLTTAFVWRCPPADRKLRGVALGAFVGVAFMVIAFVSSFGRSGTP